MGRVRRREVMVKIGNPRDVAAADRLGELGLSTGVAGTVVQALGAQAADRGDVTREEVAAYLSSPEFDEPTMWELDLGPLVDEIEEGTQRHRAAQAVRGSNGGQEEPDAP